MRIDRSRPILGAALSVVALGLAACGGNNSPAAPAQAPQLGSAASTGRVTAALSTRPATYAIPLTGGYTATLSLHSAGAPAGTKIQLGVVQPQMSSVSRIHDFSKKHTCPTTLTIPLFNPFSFPITLNVDGFSIGLPCSVDGTLFGVSFYQLVPAPAVASSLKVGDITASGKKITFTSDVATITLPARTETALSIIPEGSTSEVGIPLSAGGGTAALTSNVSGSGGSNLSITYDSGGGGGSLFSSGCDPAYPDPNHPNVIASPLANAPILGKADYYCVLGTVDSSTVGFGSSSVSFTIASAPPDRSFIGLDGPGGEYTCTDANTCSAAPFVVPVIQNVIVGNVQDMQICLPLNVTQNCNSNAGTTSGSTATSAPAHSQIDVLVADDPTYSASNPQCNAGGAAPCGGFNVTTSGSCTINTGSDDNDDNPPGYTDPAPTSVTSPSNATFAGAGPFTELDIYTQGAGTCTINVTETGGPVVQSANRSATLSVSVGSSSPEFRRRQTGKPN